MIETTRRRFLVGFAATAAGATAISLPTPQTAVGLPATDPLPGVLRAEVALLNDEGNEASPRRLVLLQQQGDLWVALGAAATFHIHSAFEWPGNVVLHAPGLPPLVTSARSRVPLLVGDEVILRDIHIGLEAA